MSTATAKDSMRAGEPPLKRRTRRPRAERRAEILASARQVFAERGYGGAAMSEVAARSGVVEGTVYSYFGSKRALLIAVMKEFYEDLIRDSESGLESVRGTENRLRFVIRRHLETFTSDLGLCRVIIREARPDVALYDEAILDLNRRYTGLALRVLEEGVENGSLRSDIIPSVIRDLIYGGIEHAVWRFVFSDGDLDVALLADQLSSAILGGIRPVERFAASATPDSPTAPPFTPPTAPLARLERAVARLETHLDRTGGRSRRPDDRHDDAAEDSK